MTRTEGGPGLKHLPADLRKQNARIEGASSRFARVTPAVLRQLRDQQESGIEAVPTFLDTWNRVCRNEGGGRGLALGWYVLLAGGTGAGKTLMALNLTAEALRQGVNVCYFSLEMSWEQLCTRLRSIVSGRDITRLEWGRAWEAEQAQAADQAIAGLDGDLYTNFEPIWELEDVTEVMRVHRDSHDVKLVVVDYAQLVSPAGSDRALFEAMSSISSELRFAAQDLGLVTVALSQLNRTSTRERSQKPTVDALFGSSRFGFDADQVAVLDYSRRERDERNRVEHTWLNLVKNRHGPCVEVPIAIEKETLRVREALPDEESDWPGVRR